MGILDYLTQAGGNLLSGARRVGGGILSGIDKVRDTIRGISRVARKVPIIDSLLKTKLPGLNQSVDDLGNIADSAIDTVKDVGRRVGIKSSRDRLSEPD